MNFTIRVLALLAIVFTSVVAGQEEPFPEGNDTSDGWQGALSRQLLEDVFIPAMLDSELVSSRYTVSFLDF